MYNPYQTPYGIGQPFQPQQHHQPPQLRLPSSNYNYRPVGIFWDIENCPLRSNKSASVVIDRIRYYFVRRSTYREYEFLVACDVTRLRKDIPDDINRSGGVTLAHVSGDKKNAADEKIREHMRRFVDTQTQAHITLPPVIILISSDIDYVNDLRGYQTRLGCEIILLYGANCSQQFKQGWHETHSFEEFCDQCCSGDDSQSQPIGPIKSVLENIIDPSNFHQPHPFPNHLLLAEQLAREQLLNMSHPLISAGISDSQQQLMFEEMKKLHIAQLYQQPPQLDFSHLKFPTAASQQQAFSINKNIPKPPVVSDKVQSVKKVELTQNPVKVDKDVKVKVTPVPVAQNTKIATSSTTLPISNAINTPKVVVDEKIKKSQPEPTPSTSGVTKIAPVVNNVEQKSAVSTPPAIETILRITRLPGGCDPANSKIISEKLDGFIQKYKGEVKYLYNGMCFISFNSKRRAEKCSKLFLGPTGTELFNRELSLTFEDSLPYNLKNSLYVPSQLSSSSASSATNSAKSDSKPTNEEEKETVVYVCGIPSKKDVINTNKNRLIEAAKSLNGKLTFFSSGQANITFKNKKEAKAGIKILTSGEGLGDFGNGKKLIAYIYEEGLTMPITYKAIIEKKKEAASSKAPPTPSTSQKVVKTLEPSKVISKNSVVVSIKDNVITTISTPPPSIPLVIDPITKKLVKYDPKVMEFNKKGVVVSKKQNENIVPENAYFPNCSGIPLVEDPITKKIVKYDPKVMEFNEKGVVVSKKQSENIGPENVKSEIFHEPIEDVTKEFEGLMKETFEIEAQIDSQLKNKAGKKKLVPGSEEYKFITEKINQCEEKILKFPNKKGTSAPVSAPPAKNKTSKIKLSLFQILNLSESPHSKIAAPTIPPDMLKCTLKSEQRFYLMVLNIPSDGQNEDEIFAIKLTLEDSLTPVNGKVEVIKEQIAFVSFENLVNLLRGKIILSRTVIKETKLIVSYLTEDAHKLCPNLQFKNPQFFSNNYLMMVFKNSDILPEVPPHEIFDEVEIQTHLKKIFKAQKGWVEIFWAGKAIVSFNSRKEVEEAIRTCNEINLPPFGNIFMACDISLDSLISAFTYMTQDIHFSLPDSSELREKSNDFFLRICGIPGGDKDEEKNRDILSTLALPLNGILTHIKNGQAFISFPTEEDFKFAQLIFSQLELDGRTLKIAQYPIPQTSEVGSSDNLSETSTSSVPPPATSTQKDVKIAPLPPKRKDSTSTINAPICPPPNSTPVEPVTKFIIKLNGVPGGLKDEAKNRELLTKLASRANGKVERYGVGLAYLSFPTPENFKEAKTIFRRFEMDGREILVSYPDKMPKEKNKAPNIPLAPQPAPPLTNNSSKKVDEKLITPPISDASSPSSSLTHQIIPSQSVPISSSISASASSLLLNSAEIILEKTEPAETSSAPAVPEKKKKKKRQKMKKIKVTDAELEFINSRLVPASAYSFNNNYSFPTSSFPPQNNFVEEDEYDDGESYGTSSYDDLNEDYYDEMNDRRSQISSKINQGLNVNSVSSVTQNLVQSSGESAVNLHTSSNQVFTRVPLVRPGVGVGKNDVKNNTSKSNKDKDNCSVQ